MADEFWCIQHHAFPDPDVRGRTRRVTTAIPSSYNGTTTSVVYCTDGQVIKTLTDELEGSSRDRNGPILIGVHSDPEVRAQEYLLSSSDQFLAHERFFTEYVRSWARDEFGISVERNKSAVFGFSNGGAFALAVALRHPHKFRAAIGFSVPSLGTLPPIPPPDAPKPSIYMAVGTQGPEKSIRKNVLRLSRWLRRNDIPVIVSERLSGHTLNFWATEFVVAIDWLDGIATLVK